MDLIEEKDYAHIILCDVLLESKSSGIETVCSLFAHRHHHRRLQLHLLLNYLTLSEEKEEKTTEKAFFLSKMLRARANAPNYALNDKQVLLWLLFDTIRIQYSFILLKF